jgi:hypothetical protein
LENSISLSTLGEASIGCVADLGELLKHLQPTRLPGVDPVPYFKPSKELRELVQRMASAT